MLEQAETLRIGPYRLVRELDPGVLGERWLALCDDDSDAYSAYRVALPQDKERQRRFVAAARTAGQFHHPHVLSIQRFAVGSSRPPVGWIVTRFPGSHDGLFTLPRLLVDKGGRMEPAEAERVVMQVLSAVQAAHEEGLTHGPMMPEEILADRRGRVLIELYGVRAALEASEHDLPGLTIDRRADEVRSVVALGYRLVTGLSADEPRMPASRLVPRLDPRWDAWFNAGLNAADGFASAAEAFNTLPSAERAVEQAARRGPVRVVLNQFRRVLRTVG